MRRFLKRTTRPIGWTLTLAFAVVLSVNCATGPEMTQAQKDCCAAMRHECGHAAQQHDCCSTESQRVDQFATAKKVSLTHPVAPVSLLAFVPDTLHGARVCHAIRSDQFSPKLRRVPTYLLGSTLLI